MILLTRDLIRHCFMNNDITDEFCDVLIYSLNKYGSIFNINVDIHIVRFLAQAKHEVMFNSNGEPRYRESLNYKYKTLVKLSRFFRRNTVMAKKFCRTKHRPANQEEIANYMYSNRLGNGDYYTGDGYRYRGFGIFQITGKSNFIEIDNEIYTKTGLRLLNYDGSINETLEIFILSGLAFWSVNKFNTCASTNCITFKINSGLPRRYKLDRLATAKRVKALLFNHRG